MSQNRFHVSTDDEEFQPLPSRRAMEVVNWDEDGVQEPEDEDEDFDEDLEDDDLDMESDFDLDSDMGSYVDWDEFADK